MSDKPTYEFVENLRKSAGTLPSERPEKRTNAVSFDESVEVELVDHNANPYKAMFLTSTATWGDNNFINKWPITSPEGKFEVVKAVLTHNTLPQAREVINFIFRVKGVPRWFFDYHTQVKFMTIMSIGCRDNNKVDADVVLHSHVSRTSDIFSKLKDLYAESLNGDGASWQSARAFMPQSYSHSYYFGQNLLAISNAINSFKEFYIDEDEQQIKYKKYTLEEFYKYYIVNAISNKFPLLGLYLSNVLSSNIPQRYTFLSKTLPNMKYDELSDFDKKYFEAE